MIESGALMAAATLGRGVVASDLPHFCEMLSGHADAGRLFAPADVASLATPVREYLTIPRSRRLDAARSLADECAWGKVVEPVGSALRRRIDKELQGVL